ncbi:hypothetical protein K7640_20985 [Micromonospora sp. PLK6-60]|uniref:hypothetical protein n=1 Tax=Micromonospora sp. PLK6-60 TaxID=2873383 RepID=UPI001CA6635D|nr:hypothetical protein [Micromonospora sp. PLK6-60]MBY8874310.1 hypothetical protein [Micromonospora sp. PLK6-60]
MFVDSSPGVERRSGPGRATRALALTGGVVLAGLLAVAAPAHAKAAAPTASSPAAAPVAAAPVAAAPVAVKATTAVAAAAIAPTISPAARRVRHVSNPATTSCPSGNLCAFVWDPTRGNWKVFDLYYCHRYSLSYWQGTGSYNNHQYGGVRVTFYGQSGNVLKTFTKTGKGTQNWNPVWSIRNC